MSREDAIVLRRAEWERNAVGQVLSIPMTWDKAPTAPEIMALVTCPQCSKANALIQSRCKIDQFGKVSPYFECAHCEWKGVIYLDKWNKRPLYAIAIEVHKKIPGEAWGTWVPEIHYCHATNEREARFHLGAGHYRIVAVAPAIGFHVEDKHGEVLRA